MIWLCVVRVFEALHFQFTTKFLYLYNLSFYDKPRITYEPLLVAGLHSSFYFKNLICKFSFIKYFLFSSYIFPKSCLELLAVSNLVL